VANPGEAEALAWDDAGERDDFPAAAAWDVIRVRGMATARVITMITSTSRARNDRPVPGRSG
jgi:hypothetical protein